MTSLMVLLLSAHVTPQARANQLTTSSFSYRKRYETYLLQKKSRYPKFEAASKMGKATTEARIDRDDFSIEASTSGDKVLGGYLIANVHGDVTVEALASKLSHNCLDYLVDQNVAQDSGDAFNDHRNHFDNNDICSSYELMRNRIAQIDEKRPRKQQLKLLGQALHAIQDFYSHSNYVNKNIEQKTNLAASEIALYDLAKSCADPKAPDKDVFTGTFAGDHGLMHSKITDEDLANPRSHLHWNKDFSPYENKEFAKMYSRASLLKSMNGKGSFYFDFVKDLQIRATVALFTEASAQVSGLNASCSLK